jgi:scyllo-inositol 2-dehydrogenase (NAD+)
MGRRHADNVLRLGARARLVAVGDADSARGLRAAHDLGCEFEPEGIGLLDRKDIQSVIIASPVETHAQLIIAAAARGKDILCEKPLSGSIADGRAAVEACARAGVRLQVGFMRRYDPAYRDLRETIARGDIGRPVLFTSISRDPRPPDRSYFTSPAAGNPFRESAVHDFDLARWLMQDEVMSVTATGAMVACPELADVMPIDLGFATLTFKTGARAAVQIYKSAGYGYDIRTEVVGTEGTIMVDSLPGDGPVRLLKPNQPGNRFPQHWLERFADAYRLEIEDWVDRMATDQQPAVTGEDGLRADEIAEAAEQSRLTGREVPVQ